MSLKPAGTLRAAACAALFLPLTGWAFSLGEISVQSGLGQAFRATIPVHASAAEEINAECFTLAPPAQGTDNTVYLRQARLSLVREGKEHKLLVAGLRPVEEPYLKVVIQGQCGGQGRVLKTYTVLLAAPAP